MANRGHAQVRLRLVLRTLWREVREMTAPELGFVFILGLPLLPYALWNALNANWELAAGQGLIAMVALVWLFKPLLPRRLRGSAAKRTDERGIPT